MNFMKKQKTTLIALLLALSALCATCNAADGAKLYLDNCATCHGVKGEGGKGLALNRQGFLVIASDVYIIKSIINGRPTRGCPPRKDLSQEELVSIASFIKGWQTEKSITVPKNRVAPYPSTRGKEVFDICAGCHDADGAGAMGPSLVDPGFLASASDGFIRATIMFGRKGTPMDGFSKEAGHQPPLSMEDIDEVVAYIRYIGKEKENGK